MDLSIGVFYYLYTYNFEWPVSVCRHMAVDRSQILMELCVAVCCIVLQCVAVCGGRQVPDLDGIVSARARKH